MRGFRYWMAGFLLPIGFDAGAAVVTLSNTTDALVDGTAFGVESSATRDITFSVADFGGDPLTILDVDVEISFLKSDDTAVVPKGIDPTQAGFAPFFDDIGFELTSPEGTTVVLVRNATTGGSASFGTGDVNQFFRGAIIFDQSAADVVNVNAAVIPATSALTPGSSLDTTVDNAGFPATGLSYKPAVNGGNLDDFNLDTSPLGVWTLTIRDASQFAAINFYDYSITITTPNGGGGTAPEPAPLLLFGAAAIPLAGIRRRRRRAVSTGASLGSRDRI